MKKCQGCVVLPKVPSRVQGQRPWRGPRVWSLRKLWDFTCIWGLKQCILTCIWGLKQCILEVVTKLEGSVRGGRCFLIGFALISRMVQMSLKITEKLKKAERGWPLGLFLKQSSLIKWNFKVKRPFQKSSWSCLYELSPPPGPHTAFQIYTDLRDDKKSAKIHGKVQCWKFLSPSRQRLPVLRLGYLLPEAGRTEGDLKRPYLSFYSSDHRIL